MRNNRKILNFVKTTTKANLAAAKTCETHKGACLLFRQLEHANDRGTTGEQFDELHEHFVNLVGLTNYCQNGLGNCE